MGHRKIRAARLTAAHRINPARVGISTARAVYFRLFVSLYTVMTEVEHGQ